MCAGLYTADSEPVSVESYYWSHHLEGRSDCLDKEATWRKLLTIWDLKVEQNPEILGHPPGNMEKKLKLLTLDNNTISDAKVVETDLAVDPASRDTKKPHRQVARTQAYLHSTKAKIFTCCVPCYTNKSF